LGFIVGEEAASQAKLNDRITLKKPIECGVVSNPEALGELVFHIATSRLHKAIEDRPLLMVLGDTSNRRSKEELLQVAFEKYHVPSFHISNRNLLSIYTYGMNYGLVLRSGDSVTEAVCTIAIRHVLMSLTSLVRRLFGQGHLQQLLRNTSSNPILLLYTRNVLSLEELI